jgi:hypothetical protein
VIEQQDEGAPAMSFARHALQFYGSAAVSLCTASDELEGGGFAFEASTRISQQRLRCLQNINSLHCGVLSIGNAKSASRND